MGIGSLRRGAGLHTVRVNLHHHEMRLFHSARPSVAKHEIVVYNRAAAPFVGAAQVRAKGAELISRVARRRIDWRKEQRLGPGDRLVVWTKAEGKPAYLSAVGWTQFPATITVRIVP